MYRVIEAGKYFDKGATKYSKQQLYRLLTQEGYDKLYKRCVLLVDDEITNRYGDVRVDYDPQDCTGVDNGDGTITITYQFYADFTIENRKIVSCYAEVTSVYDGSKITSSKVTYFNDDADNM